MHFNLTICVTILAALTLVWCVAQLLFDGRLRYRQAVRERLNSLSGASPGSTTISLFKDPSLLGTQHIPRATLSERLQRLIDESGVRCTISSLLAWSLAAGGLFAIAGSYRAWWLGALLVPVGAAAPVLVVLVRRRTRQRMLTRQLPDAFAMISRAVRAGQTVPSAFQIIAEDFDAPISTEFALCYEQQNLGMSRETALRKLATRTGIMELQLFVVALLVQARSGGDLVELLDNLAAMIRKRLKMANRIRALTGEGRMQAIVLIILPIAVFFGILFLAPGYGQTLLDRPWLLGVTAAAQAAGAFWIRKIVNFDY